MSEAALLENNFQLIAEILQAVAVLMGVGMVLAALFQLKKHAESRGMMGGQASMAGPMMLLVSGAMLLVLPDFITTAVLAFWGQSSDQAYNGGPTGYQSLVPAILMFVRVIGVGSFIRGVVLLSRSSGQQTQPGTLGKAMIHMFAGILCVHITGTISLIGSILGLA